MLIEKFLKQAKEEIIMDTVLSDEFMDKVQDNFAPIESLMAYSRSAPRRRAPPRRGRRGPSHRS